MLIKIMIFLLLISVCAVSLFLILKKTFEADYTAEGSAEYVTGICGLIGVFIMGIAAIITGVL